MDRRLGIREQVAFVPQGAGTEQLFVSLHEPLAEPRGGVLICSSLLADFLSNYQREVFLARHLAAAGLVTMRFHYAGTGNSDGPSEAVTLATLHDDARWAAGLLTEQLDGLPLALVGTRWGAITAIGAAEKLPDAPMVLCEPVTDAKRYFRDAMRSRAMSALASQNADRGPGSRLPDLLESDGYVDIVGHVIHRPLYDSAIGEDLLPGIDGHRHPALIVQFQGAELRRDLRTLSERLGSAGWAVDTTTIDLEESWWFRSGPRVPRHPELNRVTGEWLLGQLDRAAALR